MNIFLSKKMKFFITAMESKCMNVAAEQLCITRSPLSKVLYELEAHAGNKLFIRKYNSLEPTKLAISLYERTKPLYDTLCAIEYELKDDARLSILEIIFDISIPLNIYQYINTLFRQKNYPVILRRTLVSESDIRSLATKPNTALYTYREMPPDQNVDYHNLGSERVVLLFPAHLNADDFLDSHITMGIPIYIRNNEIFEWMKGFFQKALKSTIPSMNILPTDYDIASLFLLVCSGKGMVLMPENTAQLFNSPSVKKTYVPDITLHNNFYINEKTSDSSLITKIINDLTFKI